MLSAYTWGRKWLKKRAYWWAVGRRNVLGAAVIHATSLGEKEDVLQCGVTAPVQDIPLGMDSAAFEAPRRSKWLREQCGPASENRPIVLFLSRLHPKKGVVDLLLPAFAAMKVDAILAIAGGVDDSTPDYGDKVRATIQRLGLAEQVVLLGSIPPTDRWAAFDGADVFVLPSHSENFGLVVPEAMARGCPVVVTDAVQACQHVTAAGAGVVVPVTSISIAAALDKLLSDSRVRDGMSHLGRAYVADHLTWNRAAVEIANMYRSILQPTPPRTPCS
jgi:glycosyltransferase involved in cell wall biosynthesis